MTIFLRLYFVFWLGSIFSGLIFPLPPSCHLSFILENFLKCLRNPCLFMLKGELRKSWLWKGQAVPHGGCLQSHGGRLMVCLCADRNSHLFCWNLPFSPRRSLTVVTLNRAGWGYLICSRMLHMAKGWVGWTYMLVMLQWKAEWGGLTCRWCCCKKQSGVGRVLAGDLQKWLVGL